MAKIDMRFITGLRYYKETLDMLNNMTFVYDPNWNQNNSKKPTFPVCFFHVKNCHEIMTSEVSQKQMLFYNSTVDEKKTDPSLDSGLLNVVADNIVIKPKVYKLDVVVPYKNLTLLDQSFVYNTHTMNAINNALLQQKMKTSNTAFNTMSESIAEDIKIHDTYATLSQPYFSLIKTLLTTLLSTDYGNMNTLKGALSSGLSDWITNISHQPDFNKNSIETMWRMRHILKMKMWNSWEYKYVAIVDMDITKEGTEDGVYEASLTVQEMPIVTMYARQEVGMPIFQRKNPLLELRGRKAIDTLDWAGGALS